MSIAYQPRARHVVGKAVCGAAALLGLLLLVSAPAGTELLIPFEASTPGP